MFNLLSQVVLPWLHRMDPEKAHSRTLWALERKLGPRKEPPLGPGYKIFGRELRSRVGIAGGMDKNGVALSAWRAMGFGFAEIGSVTFAPRDGRPKPRLWRMNSGNALVNHMGLNGDGFIRVAENLQAYRSHRGGEACVGVNLATPDDKPGELESMAFTFQGLVDYYTYNASCPNVGHRAGAEDELAVQCRNIRAVNSHAGLTTPVLVKLPPTLLRNEAEVSALVTVAQAYLESGASGFICCNTALYVDRKVPANQPVLASSDEPRTWPTNAAGQPVGGYSGPGLYPVMLEMIRVLRKFFPEIVLIGVGGISQPHKAVDTLRAGADLVQGYTAFTYQGPKLLWDMNKLIAEAGLMKIPSRFAS